MIEALAAGRRARASSRFRAGGTSGSSSAVRCPPRSRPTGSRRPGTRTPGWSSAGPAAAVVEEVAGELAEGAPRHPGDRVVRVRHRLPDGARHVPRRRAPRSARAGGLGRRARRARRRAADPRWSRASERHVTIDRALRFLGLGSNAIVPVDADAGGRMRLESLDAALRSGRRPRDRLRAGRRGEHGRVRRGSGDRGALRDHRRVAARRRCLRPVGGRRARAPAPRRRGRARRLVGDRRPQVAQRPVRLRPRVRRPPRRPPGGDAADRGVPRGRSGRRARPDRLDARVLAPGARLHRLRRAPLAGTRGRGGARRAVLRPCAAVRRGGGEPSGMRGAERGRAQPGALPLRGRRDHERRARRTSRRAARRG